MNLLKLFSILCLALFFPRISFGQEACLQYVNEHRIDEAIIECSEALKTKNLNNADMINAYSNRSRAYSEKGNYDRAIDDLTQAIKLDPNWPVVYHNRGFAYARKGKYSEAIDNYNMAIRLNPSYELAYMSFGHLYQLMGMYEFAMNKYAKAFELNSNNEHAMVFKIIAARKLSLEKEEHEKNQLRSFIKSVPSKSSFDRSASNFFLNNADFSKEDIIEASQMVKTSEYDSKFGFCTSYYYIGENYLGRGEAKIALSYFQKSLNTGMYANPLYHLSKSIVERLAAKDK